MDPVVFFKLQLVMFFEDLRSERQLMRVVFDHLSLRWYLGYDLHETLPDHSSLTRIRERYGLEIFRRFFERIVEEGFEAGLLPPARAARTHARYVRVSSQRRFGSREHHDTASRPDLLIEVYWSLGKTPQLEK